MSNNIIGSKRVKCKKKFVKKFEKSEVMWEEIFIWVL